MAPRGVHPPTSTPTASTSASAKGKGRQSSAAAADVLMGDAPAGEAAPTHSEAEIQAWRTEQIDARQAELASIVDSHDDHVRELFHLDRFVTLIGFDPVVAKQDKSDVFLTFQHNYDLWTHATPDSNVSGGARRATRRAATERKVGVLPVVDAPVTPVASTSAAIGGRRDAKGKGRASDRAPPAATDESEGETVVVRRPSKSKSKGRKSAPPAHIVLDGPSNSRAKGKQRHSLAVSTLPHDLDEADADANADAVPSAPPQASLKHSMPPPSPKYYKRIKLAHDPPGTPTYSHPLQVPTRPAHGGSLSTLLGSYVVIDDEDHALPLAPGVSLDERAEYDASVFTRVAAFASSGRALGNPDRRPSSEPKRAKDHQDNLIDQVVYFSKLLHDERKAHVNAGRRISKMVLAHFASLKGKEEREQKELEKGQKILARWTVREVRKKWKMAFNVVKMRRKAIQKAERDRLGKEQLNAMLDKSTTMLQAQQVEMAAEDSESEADSDSDSDSSAAEEADEIATPAEPAPSEPDLDEAKTPVLDSDDTSGPPTLGRGHLQRAQSSLSVSTPADSPAIPADDPDDDDVFSAPEDAARANEDEQWEAEMEAEASDGGSEDSEIDGLVEDADLPIEELRAKYAAMEAAAAANEAGEGEDTSMVDAEVDGNDRPPTPAESDAPLSVVTESPPPADALPSPSDAADALPSPSDPPSGPVAAPDPLPTDEEAEAEAMSEFGSEADDARDNEDEQFAEEMEADNSGSDDEEMNELAADADLPIEELMAKYGYGASGELPAEPAPPSELAASEPELDTRELSPEAHPNDNGIQEYPDAEASPEPAPVTNGSHAVAESPVTEADAATPMDEDEAEEGASEAESGEESEGGEQDEQSGEEDDVVAEQVHLRPPFLLRGSLRPYQQAGLEWLASLYATGVNGILADEMGLGKTIQTISLLAHLACDKGQWGPHLVVVPTSVMLNWEMEFKKFLPGFKILTYYGNTKERKEKRRGWNTENAFHVCVTSYQLVLADQHMFRRKPWHYMILDEAHHIKNFRSQRWQTLLGFNARHRLLITGTPLQNNLMELWSLLYFLMPHGLAGDGGKGPFADHADFQAWFSNPMEKAIENGDSMDDETKATVSKLHTILRPYLLRRLKSEVETQMPGKTESIVYCRLSKRQRFLYDDFMSRSQTRETLGSGHFLSIINCLMQLRKVCNHPDLFEVRPIVTSFAMSRSVPSDFEPTELLIRKRLLDELPIAKMDWSTLTLVRPELELSASSHAASSRVRLDAAPALRTLHHVPIDVDLTVEPPWDTRTIAGWRTHQRWSEHRRAVDRCDSMAATNSRRCATVVPFFGHELLHLLSEPARELALLPADVARNPRSTLASSTLVPRLVKSLVTRGEETDDLVAHFGFVTPKVKALDMARHALGNLPLAALQKVEAAAPAEILQRASAKLSVAFPDGSLLQYDCGKLQKLDELLRECKAGGHRVLIFTQMTKVLDILEIFLSFHGHRYLRLDGSTKIEERQIITERFNSNDRILAFISSTRSGGLGINLQGADTVIFYDSDWNPALDRQCQDRAHRIGQTREVRIWRFVTEHSIEENMLKKANQKRRLDEMVIAEGDFTTDYLQKLDWRDYLDESQLKELGVDDSDQPAVESAAEIRQALAAAEDDEDAAAAKAAEGELQVDQSDFSDALPAPAPAAPTGSGAPTPTNAPSGEGTATPMEVEILPEEDVEVDPLAGTVDGYIVNFVEENWELFDV